MSESQFDPDVGSPGRSWQAIDAQLEELGLHGPFFNESGQHVQYPDYTFDINVSLLLSHEQGIIAITPETKLRSYMKTIAETCGGDFPKFAAFANPAIRKMELQNAKKFQDTFITVEGQKVRRSTITDKQSALDIVYKQLEACNHPTWQFIEQLRPALSEGLDPELFEDIRGNIAIVSAWPRLKTAYEQQITNFKLMPSFSNLLGLIMRSYGV